MAVSDRTSGPRFRYPQPMELEGSILVELVPQPPADAAVRVSARIRTASRWFTLSALVLLMAGIGFGIVLRTAATTLPDSVYWPLAAALAVIIGATALSWRTLVAARNPAAAALYYAAACLNRLRESGTRRADVQYLCIMLPFLERQLLADRLSKRAAGTRVARGHIAAVQAGLAHRIGEAECAWRRDPCVSTAKALEESIARAAVVIALDAWFTSRTTRAAGDQPTTLPAPGHVPLLPRILDSAMDKGTELGVGAIASALMLLLANTWR
jgi:hypothetical protein